MNTHVVVMAGGVGSRFWPLSTPEYPKQFIDILGCGKSLIQLTVERFVGLCAPDKFWIVTNRAYADIVKSQLPLVPEDHILCEPVARNTAPCIAWACWSIRKEDPDANIVVTPSDAVVMDAADFRRVISEALDFTGDHDSILTVGIKPSRPETGYGYVQSGDIERGGILKVDSFKEKPDIDTAREYLSDGRFLWNAGIFVWNARTIVSSFRKFAPGIASLMDRIVEGGSAVELFPQCEKISVDYAVMEHAAQCGNVFVCPADFGWSDLGNWASLYQKLSHDDNANAALGPSVTLVGCKDCIVSVADSERVVLQGLEGYIVSMKDGKLLVCRREEEQKIKDWNQQ